LPSVHSISRPGHYSRSLPSQYLFAIGLWLYLALDAHNHPFMLHYQTALLYVCGAAVRGFHPVPPAFPGRFPRSLTTSLRFYHRGLSDFARRYCRNHCCFLFLPLMICLSPRGCRGRVHNSNTGGECNPRPLSHAAAFFVVPRANRSVECTVPQ
jgi:hypothetical protein